MIGFAACAIYEDDFGKIECAAFAKMRGFFGRINELIGDADQRGDANSQAAFFIGFSDCGLFGSFHLFLASAGQVATKRCREVGDFTSGATNDGITPRP